MVALLGGCSSGIRVKEPTVTADGVQHVEIGFAGDRLTGSGHYAVPVGSTVELVVSSDVADEVHVHGYERRAFVTAGSSVTITLVADLPGEFEVELEQHARHIAVLQVS
jgi:hypothetical protein